MAEALHKIYHIKYFHCSVHHIIFACFSSEKMSSASTALAELCIQHVMEHNYRPDKAQLEPFHPN